MEILTCKGLSKRYGKTSALNGIDLSIQSGRIVGLLGPNGSGKTTLIKLANGLLTPEEGQVLICGEKPGAKSKAIVSYLPERIAVPLWMKAKDLVALYADFYTDFRENLALEMMSQMAVPMDKTVKEMSKGMREKVQLALVMSRNAKLYLLDEPIGGVDPAARDFILHTILTNYNPDAAVIISTHLITDVEQVLDEVVFLKQGDITLHSTVDEIRQSSGKSVDALFREVFKC